MSCETEVEKDSILDLTGMLQIELMGIDGSFGSFRVIGNRGWLAYFRGSRCPRRGIHSEIGRILGEKVEKGARR
jgi:hypothetical protein